MKQAIIILILVGFCVLMTSSGKSINFNHLLMYAGMLPTEPSAKTTWSEPLPFIYEKQFDNNGNADMAWDAIETPEGDFVVVGITGSTSCQLGYNWDGWVIKFDSLANLNWTRQFGGNGAYLLTSVILKGNDYVITGSKYIFPYARQACLLEINSDRNLVCEKTLGGSQDDSGADIITTSDDGFLMIGQTKSFGTSDGKSDIWLLKLNSNGGSIWTKTYDLGNEDMGTSITSFASDKFILTAVTCTANCGGLNQQGYASYIVIDSAGNILRSETFKERQKNKFFKVKSTNDGGAVIVGATSMEEKFPNEDTWVVKLNANADVVWTRIVNSYEKYDGGFDITQTSDGEYVVAGYSQAYQTPEMNFDNFCMIMLNKNGNLLWTRLWGSPDNDDAYSIIPTSEGNFLLSGFRDAVSWPIDSIPGPANFYIVKTGILVQRKM